MPGKRYPGAGRVLVLGVLALAAAPPSAGRAAAPEAQALLESALGTPAVAYQGHITVTRWYGRRAQAEEANVYFSPPNSYRWEFVSPDEVTTRVVVSDGAREQVRLLKSRRVLQGDAAKSASKRMAPERERELLARNYRLALLGSENVVGRPAWVLELTPLEAGKLRQKLWIDQATRVVLAVRRFHEGGAFTVQSRFTRFEPAGSLAPDLFDLRTDPGGAVDEHGLDPDFMSLEDLRLATGREPLPEDLPGGFVFESADFFSVRGRTVCHLRYTDGLAVVSLFQTDRPVRSRDADLAAAPAAVPPGGILLTSTGHVYQWGRSGSYFILVGDVSEGLMRRMASGLPPANLSASRP